MPIPKWLKGAPTLPKYEKDPRNVGSTNFAYSGMIGGSPDLAGPPSPAEIELWRKQRAEKVARGEDPAAVARERQAKKDTRQDKLKEVFGLSGKEKKGGSDTLLRDKDNVYHQAQENGVFR